jgi:membrane protein
MTDEISSQSPEARAKKPFRRRLEQMGVSERVMEVTKRVLVGTYTDGFTHAGNLAYLSLLTLFPFFIVAAALARIFGRTGDSLQALEGFLQTVPPDVAMLLQKPVVDVLAARSGNLLWIGALVGLWTTASFIETVRDILRRAYGIPYSRPFWEYRLTSVGIIIGSVIMVLIAFSFQVVLTGIEQFIVRLLPFATDAAQIVQFLRIAPALALFGALYLLFYTLTPGRYRKSKCPKWPGAAFVAGWWMLTTALLPLVLSSLGSYDLTYGSLAGVMIALIFFYIVGLGVVMGAELNAALAEKPNGGLEAPSDKQGKDAA